MAPKLVGTYEKELHGALGELIGSNPQRLVNIGAAEGYYAVGLACAIPSARVVAFEADQKGQTLVAELASLNGVGSRIRVEGFCDTAGLRALLSGPEPAAIVMDIEGGEKDLLDPNLLTGLKKSTILVEVHDAVHAGLEQLLVNRFSPTHQCEAIAQQDRVISDFPLRRPLWAKLLGSFFTGRAMNEKRASRVSWLFMRPRENAAEKEVEPRKH